MSLAPWSSVASGVSSGLTLVIKIFEYSYALRAVDRQTEEYFITAQHACQNIQKCRELLNNMSDSLSASEIKDYKRVIEDTSKAAREVSMLLEPARVDREADGKIRFRTRVMWVVNDDSNIAAALRRLDIVHTTLTQNISTLRLMSQMARNEEQPPTYETSELIRWKHESRTLTPSTSMQALRPKRSISPSGESSMTSGTNTESLAPNRYQEDATSYRDYSLAHTNSAPEPQRYNIAVNAGPWTGGIQRARSHNSDPAPRSWLEYQAMKSRRRQEEEQRRNVL